MFFHISPPLFFPKHALTPVENTKHLAILKWSEIQMGTYVMSDIHGEAGLFHSLLKKVNFSDSDTLYILGDVIDRGPDGIHLLKEIKQTANVIMLLGNHEYMMLQYYSPEATDVEVLRWGRNGNAPTIAAFESLCKTEQNEIIDYLKSLPTHEMISVGNKQFYLVHAFPGENVHDEVWVRPNLFSKNPVEGATLIIGHTPVISMLKSKEDRDVYSDELMSRGEHPKILHTEGFIDIDCGCSYDEPLKTLGCLRIDDMIEFYENKGHAK